MNDFVISHLSFPDLHASTRVRLVDVDVLLWLRHPPFKDFSLKNAVLALVKKNNNWIIKLS